MKTTLRKKIEGEVRRQIENHASIFLMAHRRSAADLAKFLRITPISAKRFIARLRSRGETVATLRIEGKTYYQVRDDRPWSEIKMDPLFSGVIRSKRHAPRGKAEDADYDTD